MRRRKPQLFDRAVTEAMHFLDPRSYCRRTKDGSGMQTFRFGEDMAELRKMAFERSRGYCEMPINGLLGHRCQRNISWDSSEMHHQPSLSAGGDDSLEGVLMVCRRCHTERHNRITKFRRANANK
jgi:hypothetical protein